MKRSDEIAVGIGAILVTLFLGGTAYALLLKLMYALADELSAC